MRQPKSSDDSWRRPPKDIPPDKLFRLLLRRPRPVLKLDVRLDAAPDEVLFARALTVGERSIIRDASDGDRDGLLLSLALVDRRERPIFAWAGETEALLDAEVDTLRAALWKALHVVSPAYDLCDVKAWEKALKEGASDPFSFGLVHQIRGAYDTDGMLKRAVQPRPDRYFGVPLADITDGQRMAFLVAFHLYDKPTSITTTA